MSDTRDPDRDQVEPTPNDNPSCHDLVIADMAERKAFGLRKYNSLLQAHNGRSFTLDAYEEVLDLAVYLRGKLEEERSQPTTSESLSDNTDIYRLRCRCGKMLLEPEPNCIWHESRAERAVRTRLEKGSVEE